MAVFEIFDVPEATGSLFDRLYLAMDAFAHGVSDAMLKACPGTDSTQVYTHTFVTDPSHTVEEKNVDEASVFIS